MEVKCEYCGSLIPDNVTHCPNCGAPNENMNRAAKDTPRTIEELKQWYQDRNLPPYETTRFFIGINYQKPKAFGIYQEDDTFIVYKNKADGTRTIRYKGKDEDYAVNELFLKLKSEILNQKSRASSGNAGRSSDSQTPEKASGLKGLGFDRNWLLSLLKLLGIIGGGGAGIFLLVRALQSGAFLILGAGVAVSLLVFFIGRKVFRKHKKAVLALSLVLLAATLILCSALGTFYHTPRYYRYEGIPYVWYDHDYYWYDEEEGEYTYLPEEEVPQVLMDSPDSYRTEREDLPSENIPVFTSSEDDSWSPYLDFISDNNDRDYDWDDHDFWDFGDTNWDDDW